MTKQRSPRFYFALPRLLAKWRGGDAGRAEQNGFEACSANLAIYLISFLYFAGLIPDFASWWARLLILIALAFFVWLFWLVVLYLNSLILKLLHGCGLFRALPIRRGQGVLIAAATTAMSVALLGRGPLVSEIGAIWLTATAMNLAAAAILVFKHDEPARQ
jgi:uncharacterized MAPEG superfamily protein